jgi:hypothetical protein
VSLSVSVCRRHSLSESALAPSAHEDSWVSKREFHLAACTGMPKSFYDHNSTDKHSLYARITHALAARCPLCLCVVQPVSDVLWPTREEWDGVF